MPNYSKRRIAKSATYVKKKDINKVIERKVKRMAEKKFHDTAVLTTVDTAGVINSVSDVAQGSTDSNRVGDKYRPLNVEIRGRVTAESSAALVGSVLRVIVFKWKAQSDIDVLLPAKILQQVSVTTAPFEPYNHDNRAKFQVLCDRTFEVFWDGGADKTQIFKMKCPIKGQTLFYAASTTASMNGIYVMVVSDTTVGPPTIEYKARLSYIDF